MKKNNNLYSITLKKGCIYKARWNHPLYYLRGEYVIFSCTKDTKIVSNYAYNVSSIPCNFYITGTGKTSRLFSEKDKYFIKKLYVYISLQHKIKILKLKEYIKVGRILKKHNLYFNKMDGKLYEIRKGQNI